MQKNHFLLLKKLINTESAQLWTRLVVAKFFQYHFYVILFDFYFSFLLFKAIFLLLTLRLFGSNIRPNDYFP